MAKPKILRTFRVWGINHKGQSYIGTYGGYTAQQAIRNCESTLNLEASSFRKSAHRSLFDRYLTQDMTGKDSWTTPMVPDQSL